MNKVLMILQIIPLLIEVLKAVEASIPGSGKGKEKLAMVKQILEAADETVSQVWPNLEKIISVVVSTFNAVKAW